MNWLYSHWAYATILLLSLSGLTLADYRWKLVYFSTRPGARQATLATLGLMVGFFLIWDIAGIILGIFYTNPRFTLGLNLITPNLPIEEVGFLTLLVYSCLLADVWLRRVYHKRQTQVRQTNKRTQP